MRLSILNKTRKASETSKSGAKILFSEEEIIHALNKIASVACMNIIDYLHGIRKT